MAHEIVLQSKEQHTISHIRYVHSSCEKNKPLVPGECPRNDVLQVSSSPKHYLRIVELHGHTKEPAETFKLW